LKRKSRSVYARQPGHERFLAYMVAKVQPQPAIPRAIATLAIMGLLSQPLLFSW